MSIHEKLIDAMGPQARDAYNFYFTEGQKMRARNRSDKRGHYRHTTKTDLIGKANKVSKNRKKNKAAKKARKKARK